MTLKLGEGTHQIGNPIMVGGINYFLVLAVVVEDTDTDPSWLLMVKEGDVATGSIIAETMVGFSGTQSGTEVTATVTPAQAVSAALAALVPLLADYFNTAPLPSTATWWEQTEALLMGIQLDKVGNGVSVTEPNYGANIFLNEALAQATGYTGDFGGGAFATWLAQQSPAVQAAAAAITGG